MQDEPLYERFWQRIQSFPRGLAQGAQHSPSVSGPAAAALLSAGVGCWSMMIAHHLADTSKTRDALIWTIGSWIPGSHNPSKLWGNIGSYSGKETILLIFWLGSWFLLHRFWWDREIPARVLFFGMFFLFVVAIAMTWHPLFPYLHLM